MRTLISAKSNLSAHDAVDTRHCLLSLHTRPAADAPNAATQAESWTALHIHMDHPALTYWGLGQLGPIERGMRHGWTRLQLQQR